MNAILSAIALCGGSNAALGRRLGVSGEAVRKWVVDGGPSADRVLAIAAATGWRVTPHDLRPDIYPNPTDGLPPDQRKRAA